MVEQDLAQRAGEPLVLELVTDETKTKIQIQCTREDHERLRELANESKLYQGEVLATALLLLEFRAIAEMLQFKVDPDSQISTVELAAILVGWDAGLFSEAERDLLIAYGQLQPNEGVAHRLQVMLRRMDKRVKDYLKIYNSRIDEFRRLRAMSREEQEQYLAEWEQEHGPLELPKGAERGYGWLLSSGSDD